MTRFILIVALVASFASASRAYDASWIQSYYAPPFQLATCEIVPAFSFTGDERLTVGTAAVSAAVVDQYASISFVAAWADNPLQLPVWQIVCHVAPLSFTPAFVCG